MQAGATLREGDLQRNGVASVAAIYDLVYNGRGKMPGYGTECTPKVILASGIPRVLRSRHVQCLTVLFGVMAAFFSQGCFSSWCCHP